MQRATSKAVASPLQTTVYDRVNSFLCSAIGVCGFVVLGMFAAWLCGPGEPSPLIPDDIHQPTIPMDFDDESQELVTADFEEDEIIQLKFEDVIKSVPSVTEDLSAVIAGGFVGTDQRNTSPKGKEGTDPTPGSVRNWEVRYEADSLNDYASQLDYFGIELGAVSLEDNRIVRIAQLSGNRQKTESSRSEESDSIYFSHKQRRLKRWDHAMARSMDLDFEYGVVQLFPEQVAAQMRQAELNYVSDREREIAEVENTLFEMVPDGNGWNIRVAMVEFTERAEGQ